MFWVGLNSYFQQSDVLVGVGAWGQIVRIITFKTNRMRNKGTSLEMGTRQHWKHVYEGNEASATNILANWENF